MFAGDRKFMAEKPVAFGVNQFGHPEMAHYSALMAGRLQLRIFSPSRGGQPHKESVLEPATAEGRGLASTSFRKRVLKR